MKLIKMAVQQELLQEPLLIYSNLMIKAFLFKTMGLMDSLIMLMHSSIVNSMIIVLLILILILLTTILILIHSLITINSMMFNWVHSQLLLKKMPKKVCN